MGTFRTHQLNFVTAKCAAGNSAQNDSPNQNKPTQEIVSMSTTVKQSGGDFVLPPVGTHRARCYRVVDLGTQSVQWQGKAKDQQKVLIAWELCDEPMEDGKPFTVSQRFTASLSDKANLRHTLESWRGKPFTAQELDGFSLKTVLAAPCLLTVAHEKSKDGQKTYANIKAVTPLAKGMQPPPALVNDKVHYEVEQGEDNVFATFPDWLKKVISQSREWQHTGGDAPQGKPEGGKAGEPEDDSGIPF